MVPAVDKRQHMILSAGAVYSRVIIKTSARSACVTMWCRRHFMYHYHSRMPFRTPYDVSSAGRDTSAVNLPNR